MEFVYCIADICEVVTRLLTMYMALSYSCSGSPDIKLYHVKKTKKINHSNNKLKRQKLTMQNKAVLRLARAFNNSLE